MSGVQGRLVAIRDNLQSLSDLLAVSISHVERYDQSPDGGRTPALLQMWARSWRRSRRQMFATQGRSSGVVWPFYTQTGERTWYLWQKQGIFQRRMTPRDVLRWVPGEDRLYRSLTRTNARGYYERRTRTGLTVGSSLWYARKHQEGAGRAPRFFGGHAIPRRPIVNLGPYGRQLLEADAVRYAEGFSAAFGVRGDQLAGMRFRR